MGVIEYPFRIKKGTFDSIWGTNNYVFFDEKSGKKATIGVIDYIDDEDNYWTARLEYDNNSNKLYAVFELDNGKKIKVVVPPEAIIEYNECKLNKCFGIDLVPIVEKLKTKLKRR